MTAPKPPTLRVASYNIRKALGTDRRRDPHRILDIIAELQADVVVLQEADMRLGARPSALPLHEIVARTGLVPISVAAETSSLGWHGNAILIRPSVRVEAMAKVDLPGLEPRGAVFADLVVNGMALRVIGVHLGLLRASRRRQLAAIIAKIQTLDATPTLLAGDLNEWSLRVGLGRLAHHFTIHAPGRSFHANIQMASLDRIALDQHLESRATGVFDTAVSRRASDHLPIWMDITTKTD